MVDLTEMNKLESYLKERHIQYERIDTDRVLDAKGLIVRLERHQICVPSAHGSNREWDVICHYGSYGYEAGLLEIYGTLVNEKADGDSVVGYLTADDVIKRIEKEKII